MKNRLELTEQKEKLAQQLDTDNIKMLDAFVMKDVLGLNNDEVANIAGKSRTTLQRLLREPVASEYVEVSQQIRELDKENLGTDVEEINALQAFSSIKKVLFTKALAGEAKAIDLLLKHHSVLIAIEEQQAKEQQAWEATQENVQQLINELDQEIAYNRKSEGYTFTVEDTTADHIRAVMDLLDLLYQMVIDTPTDALNNDKRYELKRFYFELTSTIRPLLQAYGVSAERITRL